jgi:hypothetical protein
MDDTAVIIGVLRLLRHLRQARHFSAVFVHDLKRKNIMALNKPSPTAILIPYCPELLKTVEEGYANRFIPLHNGSLFCLQENQYYNIDDLDFFEVTVETSKIRLFKVRAPDGINGFILQKFNS